MSTNDVPSKATPGQARTIQAWSTTEEEHVRSHLRKHDKNWRRRPESAARSCVREWLQLHPDKADKLKIHDVIEFSSHGQRTGQGVRPAQAKNKALLPGIHHPQKYSSKSKVPCVGFPPCQEDFMYMEDLVNHILRKHANRNSMQCGCGQTFTRRIDLQSHVELSHIGDKWASPSIRGNADDDVAEGKNQPPESRSTQVSRNSESQTPKCCSRFPPCAMTFWDEQKFNAHVKSHKGWVKRRAKQGRSLAQANKSAEYATATVPGTNTKKAATQLGISRTNSLAPEERCREAMRIDSSTEPDVTAPSSQESGNFVTVGNAGEEGEDVVPTTAGNAYAGSSGLPKHQTGERISQESRSSYLASQADMWANQGGMGHLSNIEEQLRQSVSNILERAVVPALPDPQHIFRHMRNITTTTTDMIAKLLSPYSYRAFVEYRATCLEQVTELSALVFGDTREEEILKVAYAIQFQNQLPVETLLRAYTAAAVTQWVLRVDFRERYGARGTVCNGPDIRWQNMEEFIKRASPDLHSVLHQKYFQDYLQSQVAPGFDPLSWKLTDNLYHVLLRLFNGKVGEIENGSQQLGGVSASDHRMNLSNSVRSLLFQIFKEAHELSLLMHKHPVGYDINLPAWPEKFVAKEMRTLEPQFPHAGGQVSICVCPRISHKGSLDTIVPALVSLL